MPVSASHVTAGVGLAVLGTAATALGAWGHPIVPATIVTLPGHVVALVAGGVLAAGGALVFAAAFRKDEPEETIVPAHVAFMSRPKPTEDVSDAMARLAPQRPKRATRGPESPVDARIRDITREINRAGVMLATGKLSGDAYTDYVESLKRQRGELEATVVRGEMAGD